ncbi:VanW family protein [Nocardia camponoti]|uniref:Vanomycin resistance protein VanB n=1 Tax=Nocardia camponoti TaxID=1616106 RepID=A0A917V9G1_9NOCA|nr:VanW family protein [Nocardia camponoti]GGK52889.1 vanomycin resistance protein VanB [Nocardia camponoti]
MPSESTTGYPGDRPRGEVGLRKLLEANRTFDNPGDALTRPIPKLGAPRPGTNPPGLSPTAKRVGVIVGAVFATATLAYLADLALSTGEVPRGVVVAGVDVGGMDRGEANALLHSELEPRADQPVPVRIGDVSGTLIPSAAGLRVDFERTWEAVGDQPLNPVRRLVSLFGTRDVQAVSTVDDAAFSKQLADFASHDNPTVEGTVRFQNGKPVAVLPVPGRVLDQAAARELITTRWASQSELSLPIVAAPVAVRAEAVQATLRDIATPAVSAPVQVKGRDATATLSPTQIADVLTFVPDGAGGLAPKFANEAATALLAPQLAATEVEPKDATFAVEGGRPTVVPAVVGDKIDWAKTLEKLPAVLTASARSVDAVHQRIEPKLTTDAANALGINEVVGQFTTGGFSGPSGVNIRTVAAKVDGAIVKPGEVFSLNGFTGPRTTAEGYVESGIIDKGRPSTAVGGGISQFATTLYNAAYFAGMEDEGHTEHSYYISRYPAAREATVFDGAIDLAFRNPATTGIYIQAIGTGSDITVRLWGTKTVNVESITGEKTKPTEPTEVKLPKGKDCIASTGAPGFTISDTRVITDHKTGAPVSQHTRTVKYDPVPVVICEDPAEAAAPAPAVADVPATAPATNPAPTTTKPVPTTRRPTPTTPR